MKPCSRNRQQIALLALGDREAGRDRTLREHLETCAACRDYLAEISNVAENLRAVEPNSEFRASDSFHRRTMAALEASEAKVGWQSLLSRMPPSLLDWRLALPTAAAVAVLIALLSPIARHPAADPVPAPTARAATPPTVRASLDPTVANYQMVANQSFEKLDELLTLQGRRNPPSAPVYTASLFSRLDASD